MIWRGLAGVSIVGVLALAVAVPRGGDAQPAPLRVAVMEFTNAAPSGELATLGKGLQSMFTTDLAQVPSLQLVERARLADLVGELKLGTSGLVEARTASRIGKLAGATHLLAGSFTVVGARMRLDGRLFGVESGQTLLAESVEGEKDAFFELEKSLVAKIVDKLGVKLLPKERAALARPHTTDFGAFQSFSDGVALFDDKKYDEAVAALRAAAGRDQDFKLAIVTLAEYQRVIAEVRGRADELAVSGQQLAALERQKAAHDETEMLKRLFALASRKGAEAAGDRLAARRAIAEAYGNTSNNHHVLELQSFEDRFALQRTADAFTQSYYAEALSLFPRYPLVLRGESSFPKTIAEYDKWWRELRDSLECRSGECNRKRVEDLRWWGNMPRPVDFFGRRLHLDARGEAELHDRLYQLAVQAGAGPDFKTQALARLASDYRAAGDFARSTRAFTELAGILRDPGDVRKVADQLEINRKATLALERSPHRELLREAFVLGPAAAYKRPLDELVGPRFVSLFAGPAPTPRALSALADMRQFPRMGNDGSWRSERYVWVDDQPVWLLQQRSHGDTTFAPRSDLYRATEIRHFMTAKDDNREPSLKGTDSLLIVEGVPRGQVGLRFSVDFTSAADWWPPLAEPYDHTRSASELVDLDGRPEVGVLFALEDVDCMTFDRDASTTVPGRPLRGYLLTIDAGAVRVSAIHPGKPSRWMIDQPGLNLPKSIVRQPVGEAAIDLGSVKRLEVSAGIQGKSIQATVNGRSFSFALPAAAPAGFYGLQFRGAGYAAIKGLKVTHPR